MMNNAAFFESYRKIQYTPLSLFQLTENIVKL